jgi:hypothetical protein
MFVYELYVEMSSDKPIAQTYLSEQERHIIVGLINLWPAELNRLAPDIQQQILLLKAHRHLFGPKSDVDKS